jgi:hypothetical protein
MKIQFTNNDQVTLECSTIEFALFNAALNSFLQLARNPQCAGDRAAESDYELANELEQQMFKAYCAREFPENSLPAKEQPKYVSHQPKGQPFSVSRFLAECREQDRQRKEAK